MLYHFVDAIALSLGLLISNICLLLFSDDVTLTPASESWPEQEMLGSLPSSYRL
jgi:hypothetical protein